MIRPARDLHPELVGLLKFGKIHARLELQRRIKPAPRSADYVLRPLEATLGLYYYARPRALETPRHL